MPSAATDILSLDSAKAALRIDGTDGDTDLAASITAAVDYCEQLAGKPLLDVTKVFDVARPGLADSPILIPAIYIKSISAIAYWTTTQKLREDPNGTILVAYADPDNPGDSEDPIGRTEVVDRDCTAVWPPSAGWPTILDRSKLRVTVVQGWDDAAGDSSADGYDVAADIPGIAGIRKAVAVMTGVYYDGIVEDTHRRAVLDLLQPFRDARFLV